MDGAVPADDLSLLLVASGHLEKAASVLEAALHQGSFAARPDAAAEAHQDVAVAARLESDLAAVQLARSAASHDPYLAFQALVAAERAVSDQPTLAEARFNRALALEAVGIDWEAREAWRAYLVADPGSGWGREARARLQALRVSPRLIPWSERRTRLDAAILAGDSVRVLAEVRADPQAARDCAEQELLPAWGSGLLARQPAGARRALDEARALGSALRAFSGDGMAADSVSAIDTAAAGNPARLAILAAGHRAYGEALAAGLDLTRSKQLLARAERLLAQGRSPFAYWALMQEAIADYRRSDYRRALLLLRSLTVQAEERYPTLRAKALRVIALAEGVQGNYAPARASLEACAQIYRRTGETQNLVAVLTLLATAHQSLGDVAGSWRVRCEALHLARQLHLAPYLLFGESAIDAFGQGQPRIARYFQEQGVRQAEQTAEPATLAGSLRARALIYHRLGEPALAHSDLLRAMDQVPRLPAGDLRRSLYADLLAVAGELSLVDDPRLAAGYFQEALAIYSATGYHLYLSQLHQRCAEAWIATNDLGSAEREYRAALVEREQQRALLPDERQRTVFFDGVEPVFEEAALFTLARLGDPERAFDLAERVRARSLLDRLAGNERRALGAGDQASADIQPLPAADIRAALGSSTTIVTYLVLEERTAVWVMTRDTLHAIILPAGRRHLVPLLDLWRSELTWGQDQQLPDGPAALLYKMIVAPIEEWIPHGSRVVFVADKCLDLLPFGALYNSGRRGYLLSDHPVASAPSATLLVHALQRDRQLSEHPPASVLLVGDPDARGYAPLPGARLEVEGIRRLYGSESTLLTGALATRRAFLAALPGREVIHLANHTLSDLGHAESPGLVLADDADSGAPGLLRTDDLLAQPLSHIRLVVLAGCDTGSGPLSSTEGPLSLVRPFLAGGVPAVVAALWPVDDASSSELLIDLHRRLRDGVDAMSALRAAQLRLLASGDPHLRRPAAWAAFEMFGGTEPRVH